MNLTFGGRGLSGSTFTLSDSSTNSRPTRSANSAFTYRRCRCLAPDTKFTYAAVNQGWWRIPSSLVCHSSKHTDSDDILLEDIGSWRVQLPKLLAISAIECTEAYRPPVANAPPVSAEYVIMKYLAMQQQSPTAGLPKSPLHSPQPPSGPSRHQSSLSSHSSLSRRKSTLTGLKLATRNNSIASSSGGSHTSANRNTAKRNSDPVKS